MTYHMRDVKNIKPSLVEESLAKALLALALAMSATAFIIAIGADVEGAPDAALTAAQDWVQSCN